MSADKLYLRPLTISDIIDASIWIYRRNFAPILGIAAVVQIPIMVVGIAVQVSLMPILMASGQSGSEVSLEQMSSAIGPVVLLFLMSLLYPLGQAALAIGISERYLGRPISVRDAYEAALPRWGQVLWTTILYWLIGYGVFIGGLLIAGFVLMIWLMVRYMLGPAVINVLENRSGWDALARSWSLTAGHFWRIFGALSILMLLAAVVTYGVSLPTQILATVMMAQESQLAMAAQILNQVVSSLVSLLLQPLWMIGVVLVYYDLRIRKEGFDLMMMAESLGRPAPADWIGLQQQKPSADLPGPLFDPEKKKPGDWER
ncbi:MAG: glycerophosphoryl diester phosphodiesterase membrane domain-containing protein [Armatimonadetes bacterium]|nr:glycerophosphoryl diester phosphodiesterase membrane domain-containing protein [Armatimonadota bacterium]